MCGPNFQSSMIAENGCNREEKCAALIDLQKPFDRVGWETMWDALKVYEVGASF